MNELLFELAADVAVAVFFLALTGTFLARLVLGRRRRDLLVGYVSSMPAMAVHLEEGVCLVDRDGRIRYLNPAAERMLGLTVVELRGTPVADLLPGKQTDGEEELQEHPVTAVIRSGAARHVNEVDMVRRDGITVSLSYTVGPIVVAERVVGATLSMLERTERGSPAEEAEPYRSMVESSPDGMLLADVYGYILTANQRAASLYGYPSPDAMLGMNIMELVAPEDRFRAIQDKRTASQLGSVTSVEYRSRKKDGTTFQAEVSVSAIVNEQAEVQGLVSSVRDVSDRKYAEETLRASEARLTLQYSATRALAESGTVDEAVWRILQLICADARWELAFYWVVDQHQNVLRCHDIWRPPWVTSGAFVDASWERTVPPDAGPLGRVWTSGQPLWIPDVAADPTFTRAAMAAQEGLHGAFYLPIPVAGTRHGVMEFYAQGVRPENAELRDAMVTIGLQVGKLIERKVAEEALEHQAMHDALTDLPNRSLLFDRLTQALSGARRSKRPFALLVMDLDKFKQVNDTLGHHYGDVVLQEAAERLQHTLRGSDTVARLGGDEFAMLLPGTDEKGALQAAEKVVAALEQPFVVDGEVLDVGISVGVALHPQHGEDASTLLQRADAAMYLAKRSSERFALYGSAPTEGAPSSDVHSSGLP